MGRTIRSVERKPINTGQTRGTFENFVSLEELRERKIRNAHKRREIRKRRSR